MFFWILQDLSCSIEAIEKHKVQGDETESNMTTERECMISYYTCILLDFNINYNFILKWMVIHFLFENVLLFVAETSPISDNSDTCKERNRYTANDHSSTWLNHADMRRLVTESWLLSLNLQPLTQWQGDWGMYTMTSLSCIL